MKKILVASDIHGSSKYCKKLIEVFYQENADTLLLLGDILDGDREVAAMLNELNQHKLILAVRGNCDYPEDQALLAFPIMAEYCLLYVNTKRIYAAHGHRGIPNLTSGDIFLHGHTHVPTWGMGQNYFDFNPGSASEPRRGSPRSYMVIDDEGFTWKDLNGTIIHNTAIKETL